MEGEDADTPLEPRPPTLQDLLLLCRSLNEAGARYIVIGGWAVIHHGFDRTTSDIDLLVEDSTDNFGRLRKGMLALPDGAIRDVALQGESGSRQRPRNLEARSATECLA